MTASRILVVDSDKLFIESTRELFLNSGFEVEVLTEMKLSEISNRADSSDVIILDGSREALEQIASIRSHSQIPLIITSTRSDLEERIKGLEAGADDFLAKPYSPRELLARIKSLVRRASLGGQRSRGYTDSGEWLFKGLTIQSGRRRVFVDKEPVELTTAEFDLLRLLVTKSQSVLSREKILEEMRGITWESVDRSIDILVSRLREKLRDDPRRPRFIRTVRSIGYQFIAEPVEANAGLQTARLSQSEAG